MRPKPDFYKRRVGKTLEEKRREHTTAEQIVARKLKRGKSSYPVDTLGVGADKLFITEEERSANYHIIGQPRQGKSKLIEDSIRKDIDLGNGLCLIDPSENGDTCKKILRYCASKGIENVVYIDPDLNFKLDKIPVIQPLKPYPYNEQSIDSILESINALFGVSNQTDTNRIRRNFSALLNVLSRNNLTLHEAKYFRRYTEVNELPFLGFDEDSETIKDAFRNITHFNNYYITTVGRLDVLRQNPVNLMTASNTGIDFIKMVKEGWVILVNLYPNKSLSITQARLLGIFIIAEIIHAMTALFGFEEEGVIKKIFYLYIDEAARFATPQIADVLDYRGKIGLRFVMAHHYFSQFEDKRILDSIKQGCRIKMMFNMSSYEDRFEMVKDLGYGGDIPPLLAAYANQDIPKQVMIIKKDKETPVRIRVPDVPDVYVEKSVMDAYINRIMDKPWYLTKQEIQQQIDARSIQTNTTRPQPRKVDESETNSETFVPRPIQTGVEKTVRPSDKKPSQPPPKRPIKI